MKILVPVISGLVACIGAFMPWMHVGDTAVRGVQGDGLLLVGAAFLGVILALLRAARRGPGRGRAWAATGAAYFTRWYLMVTPRRAGVFAVFVVLSVARHWR